MVIYVKERKHMNNQKLGIIGENAACEFLEAKGYNGVRAKLQVQCRRNRYYRA